MDGQKNGSMKDTRKTSTTLMSTGTNVSPALDQLKKDLFVAIEILNGYTEAEALKNYECEQGTCQCP